MINYKLKIYLEIQLLFNNNTNKKKKSLIKLIIMRNKFLYLKKK